MSDKSSSDDASEGGILYEVFSSPLNLALVAVIAFMVYKIFKSYTAEHIEFKPVPELPPMKKRDFTVEELKKYDGNGEDGRILIAVNGKVFDVTKGKKFYGPGGPYSVFAGRDASRSLAKFSVGTGKDGYDDLSDLDTREMESVREWEMQFTERYDYIGKLLKPGQEPTNYSDDEEDTSQDTPPNTADQQPPAELSKQPIEKKED